MTPGIYDISNKEYHASEGISRSAISELQKSPLHYWMKYLAPEREPQEPTRAMILGSAVHTLVLEPHLFEKEFAVMQKVDLRTNAGKSYKADFELASTGKLILNESDLELATNMANAVLSHRMAGQLLNGASIEKSIYWNDVKTGLLCKARPDAWNESIEVICDIKTAADSTREAFMHSIKDGNYHIQAAMQIDAIKEVTGKSLSDFVFIVVQNIPPYMPYIYRLEEDIIEHGREEYKSALKILKRCIETNHWSRDRDCVLPVFLKEWQKQSTFYNLLDLYQA